MTLAAITSGPRMAGGVEGRQVWLTISVLALKLKAGQEGPDSVLYPPSLAALFLLHHDLRSGAQAKKEEEGNGKAKATHKVFHDDQEPCL